MKTILIILLAFVSAVGYSQNKKETLLTTIDFMYHGDGTGTHIFKNNDTLFIPVGAYKFIKIGDRVYEIETKLKEAEPIRPIGNFYLPYYSPNFKSSIMSDSALFFNKSYLLKGV